MNIDLLERNEGRTSASSPMRTPKTGRVIPRMLGWYDMHTGTFYFAPENITSTEPVAPVFAHNASLSSAIYDVRRLTGLTWDELATLFKVNRRSVHYWANGGTLKPHHARHLSCVLDTVRQFERRGAALARLALLTPNAEGVRPIDLLAQGRYTNAVVLFNSTPRSNAQPTPHPNKSLPHPVNLMDALPGRPDEDRGAFIAGRGRRLPKRRP
jgi:hypothetical protein